MITVLLVVLGLILGSFVNALVWRIHEQGKGKADKKLSIFRGRSMCPNCKHELSAADLVPVFSWLSLKGKCRYCSKPISSQYPLVEAVTALLFVFSYLWWPVDITGLQGVIFGLWVLLLVGFMALIIYDLKWMLLPNRILYPTGGVAALIALLEVVDAIHPVQALLRIALAVAIGGGIFYLLFQLSDGKWIGGGDVKLGWILGLVVGSPARSLLFIFIAAVLGSLVSLPLLMRSKLKRTSVIPFGPFLIIGAIVVQLFGTAILQWYRRNFLNF